ncbi:MAG: MEDS domain-containing protein [Candidatus Thorarchaeota archaeon]|jgi:hypothetical protein
MESISFTAPHTCCLYHSDTEDAIVVHRFLQEGLTRREKILYIIDPLGNTSFLNGLPHEDVDVVSAITRGQLVFLTTLESYLQTSPFDPAHMIQLLHRETDQALEEGYTGLRVTADMTWALHHNVPPHTLIAYETQVDAFINHGTCTGLCRYGRWSFPSTLLEDILPIHSSIITQGREYTNTVHSTFSDLLRDLD